MLLLLLVRRLLLHLLLWWRRLLLVVVTTSTVITPTTARRAIGRPLWRLLLLHQLLLRLVGLSRPWPLLLHWLLHLRLLRRWPSESSRILLLLHGRLLLAVSLHLAIGATANVATTLLLRRVLLLLRRVLLLGWVLLLLRWQLLVSAAWRMLLLLGVARLIRSTGYGRLRLLRRRSVAAVRRSGGGGRLTAHTRRNLLPRVG